jgi:hypothetical protein
MSTVFEAFLATAIFVLLLAAVVAGVSYILNSRFSELRRAMLKAKAEAAAQAVALYLETSPVLLKDREGLGKLGDEVKRVLDGYVHKIVLNGVEVVQTQVNVTFPLRLTKGGDGYRVDPPVNVYVIRFLGDGKYLVESASGGTVRVGVAKESAVAVVASGAVYVISNILKPGDLPQTIEKDSYCYAVHFEGSPCVTILKKGGDEKSGGLFEYSSNCFASPQGSFTIKMGALPDAIGWLKDNGFLKAPYGVLCPSLGTYYVYPKLDTPIVLFRSIVPRGVVAESFETAAVVDGCVVLVKVVVWD